MLGHLLSSGAHAVREQSGGSRPATVRVPVTGSLAARSVAVGSISDGTLARVLQRAVHERAVGRPVLARYFDGARFDMPGTRFSDTGLALLKGKQELWAAREIIDEGNRDLTRVELMPGDKYAGDDFPGNLSRGAGKPLYRVRARLRPSAVKQIDPMLKMLGEASPAPNDSVGQLAIKSDAYAAFVEGEMAKIGELVAACYEWLHKQQTGFFGQSLGLDVNAPMSAERWRDFGNKVLQPWMIANQVASQYLNEARLHLTFELGAAPPSLANVTAFAATAEVTRLTVLERELDRARKDELILPVDCFTAALALGARHVKNKPAPDIGETHFVDLASDTGWNNHWATVIMRDGADTITLENAAETTKGPVDRTTWWFGMYGTRVAGQSFEDEYRALSAARSSGIATRMSDIAARRKPTTTTTLVVPSKGF